VSPFFCFDKGFAVRTPLLAALGLAATFMHVSAASAQLQPQNRPAGAARWEVEIHGGGGINSTFTDGRGALPPAGQTFITLQGLPSERVPSWYFGDGAQLLNAVNQLAGIAGRVDSLDSGLQSAASQWGGGVSLGGRVSYALTSRVALEFNLDAPLGTRKLTSDFLDRVERTRASFISAWQPGTGFLGVSSLITSASATSAADIQDAQGRQIFVTGAVRFTFAERRSMAPYVTAGAGIVSNAGDGPSVTLNGNYHFAYGTAPQILSFNESDRLQIRIVPRNSQSLVGVFGGGVRLQRWARSGIRLDARAYISQNTDDVVVDASPVVTPGTALTGAIATLTFPSLQISNSTSASLPSTLGAPGVTGFTTFASSGNALHISFSAGYFVRF
jgi:hypothetical protein